MDVAVGEIERVTEGRTMWFFKPRQLTAADVEKRLAEFRTIRNRAVDEFLAGRCRVSEAAVAKHRDEVMRLDSICSKLARDLAEMRRFKVKTIAE